ncbi:hypothetical protein [Polyangium fumosum]|uniref:Uncharacterized protein n=1 Tax=Polyangium fumosum TaxID=889272 RepID=A0A4U1JFF8_9BACT|nr:hypothetical protein [Polyangium fumosum]TKD09153.1 hypothetical protein E8A74_12770 [Polyangium fumosum]
MHDHDDGPLATVRPQFARLYGLLARHLPSHLHTGAALASEPNFWEAFKIILSDAKDLARVRVARAGRAEVWVGFYADKPDADCCVEIVQLKERGEFGIQVARWGLRTLDELLAMAPREVEVFFAPVR